MNTLPETVQVKLDRAQGHIRDLRQVVAARFDEGTYRFTLERESDSPYHVLRVYDLPSVDREWSGIIGDALFNIRSSLDHLADLLVRANGNDPTHKTQFPILDKPPRKKGVRVRPWIAGGVSDAVRDDLEWMQPYSGGYPMTLRTEAEAQRHPLSVMARLNNVDKHRTLLVASSAFNIENSWWTGNRSGRTPPTLHGEGELRTPQRRRPSCVVRLPRARTGARVRRSTRYDIEPPDRLTTRHRCLAPVEELDSDPAVLRSVGVTPIRRCANCRDDEARPSC